MSLRTQLENMEFGLSFLKAKLTGKYVPFYVGFFVNKHCNFSCMYCYGKYNEYQGKEVPLSQVKQIIAELDKAGTKRICILGGEPLLRNDIGEIVNDFRDRRIQVIMNTNGELLRKRIKDLKRLNHVYVSFDGTKEGHDANRGAGTYEKALDGIDAALEEGIPLGIVSVMTNNNIQDLPFIVDFAKQRNLSLYVYTAMGQVEENGDKERHAISSLPTPEEYRPMIQKILDEIDKGAPIRYSKKVYENSLNWPDYKQDTHLGTTPDFDHIKCWAGKFHASIDADGNMFPCVRQIGVDKPGNILADGFETSWKIVNNHNCKACHIESVNELNLFFSMNAGVIKNYFKNTWIKE